MDALTDKEIYNASAAIDEAFAVMTKENRGKTARAILKNVRDLNDHIADKVWADISAQPMDLNKVASKLSGKYRFISRFDHFLRSSVSHFTPSEDGAERLLIRYYKYLIQLKQLMWQRYNMDILKNIDCFIENTDTQTKEYYEKVAISIDSLSLHKYKSTSDNYYVDRIKPFYINNQIYYEVTLEPANDRPNKFQRITAFTKHDIFDNYSVELQFVDSVVDVFNTQYPIKIITDWHVSIRPCEINNFAYLIGKSINIQRRNNDYKALMEILTNTHYSLVDIIDLPTKDYDSIKNKLKESTRYYTSSIEEILSFCRIMSINNHRGKNIIRYLLYRLNNKIIKDQRPTKYHPNRYADFNLSSKCVPFDLQPYAHYPKGHITNLFDLYQCIDAAGHEPELLKRYIDNNTYSNHILFTPVKELAAFGNEDEIRRLIKTFNGNLYQGFKPDSELDIYKGYVFVKGYEQGVCSIFEKLTELSSNGSEISENFNQRCINQLEQSLTEDKLDDPLKKKILTNMFSKSKIHCIYGAAGTGKTTLVNHICRLLENKNKIFLAKTHPAVENLRRKVTHKHPDDQFVTIDQFTKSSYFENYEHDLIVVDECSTVKNEEIIKILERLGDSVLVLTGDTYQIESIGFGNWFSLIKNILPEFCCHELTTPYRSDDKYLLKLWTEVRNMNDNNVALERMVRSEYSHVIDDDIFNKKANDEIILCLNYNGLYGLNNINKLLQLSNPNHSVQIGVWEFKKGDPVLFNDSNRFKCLYNNLKGKIIDIQDGDTSVKFTIRVDVELDEDDIFLEEDLELVETNKGSSTVAFYVNRVKPYYSDEEETSYKHIVPFQVAYAVSIHKSQGLEYESVKIVIADETEDRITHNIFYTAITRAKKQLTLYWSPEVCNRILARIRPTNNSRDYELLKTKNNI